MTTMQLVEGMTDDERAHAGAELFDVKEPDWFKRIDPLRLSIGSAYYCAVGQVKQVGYFRGLADMGVLPQDAPRYGFSVPTPELHQAWLREIESRRMVEKARQNTSERELAGVA